MAYRALTCGMSSLPKSISWRATLREDFVFAKVSFASPVICRFVEDEAMDRSIEAPLPSRNILGILGKFMRSGNKGDAVFSICAALLVLRSCSD